MVASTQRYLGASAQQPVEKTGGEDVEQPRQNEGDVLVCAYVDDDSGGDEVFVAAACVLKHGVGSGVTCDAEGERKLVAWSPMLPRRKVHGSRVTPAVQRLFWRACQQKSGYKPAQTKGQHCKQVLLRRVPAQERLLIRKSGIAVRGGGRYVLAPLALIDGGYWNDRAMRARIPVMCLL